jgi:hypothetical protein
LYRHVDDLEAFSVVEGEVRVFVDGAPGVTVGAGAFVYVPAGAVHGFRVESGSARYLILTTPHHGAFYEAITLPARTGGEPPLESLKRGTSERRPSSMGSSSSGRSPTPAKQPGPDERRCRVG